MIADGEVVDTVAERLDDTRTLVSVDLRAGEEDRRELTGQQVGVAHTGGDHADQHLARSRRLELQFLDGELAVAGTQDRR